MSRNMSVEGRRNAARAQSSIISSILNQNSNFRSDLEKRGIQPKNHHKDNLKYIQNIAKQNKEKQEEMKQAEQLKKKRFLLNKFAHVDSKLKTSNRPSNSNSNSNSINSSCPTTSRSKSSETNHILQNKKNVQNMANCNPTSSSHCQRLKRKQDMPTKEEFIKIDQMIKHKHYSRKKFDYISQNRKNAIDSKPKQQEDKEVLYINKENYGKIPDYIVQRRLELAEQHKKELS